MFIIYTPYLRRSNKTAFLPLEKIMDFKIYAHNKATSEKFVISALAERRRIFRVA